MQNTHRTRTTAILLTLLLPFTLGAASIQSYGNKVVNVSGSKTLCVHWDSGTRVCVGPGGYVTNVRDIDLRNGDTNHCARVRTASREVQTCGRDVYVGTGTTNAYISKG